MEFMLGTEPRREYYAFEVAAAAHKMLTEVMLVKPDETVVITADTQSDWRVVKATAQAALTLRAHPTVIWYETRPHTQMEPYPPVAAAVQTADVWVEYAVQYILYTDARRTACRNGCRYAAFGGLDVDALVRTIGRVDYPTMLEMGEQLIALTQKTSEFRITTALGTDLQCNNQGAEVWQSGRLGDEPGAAVRRGKRPRLTRYCTCCPVCVLIPANGELSTSVRLRVGYVPPPQEKGPAAKEDRYQHIGR